jgi:hypothetical protein
MFEYWGFSSLECSSIGVSHHWNVRVLGFLIIGIPENPVLEFLIIGIFEYLEFLIIGIPEIPVLEFLIIGIFEYWK